MAEVAYYFNAYTVGVWTDPDNIVDGNIGTFGYTNVKKTAQVLTGNTCPGDDLGTITKVEIRLFGYGDGNDRIDITPVFTGGNGDEHETTPQLGAPGDWTDYVDITNDTNHPDWSLWSHIQDLDCIIDNVAVAKGNTMYCAKVEIRVTYIPPSDIDVGGDCIDRASLYGSGFTTFDVTNPANANGILHTIVVWAGVDISGLIVGTFYHVMGNTYKCRDSAVIGDVAGGSIQVFDGLSIAVQKDDWIGCYFTSGSIEYSTSGFLAVKRITGEYIDPGDEAAYEILLNRGMSLYGYGDIVVPVAPTVTTQAVSNILHITATGNGNITNTGGENPSKQGVCWNTTGNPTVADSKSEEIDSFGPGAFVRPMTGLTRGQHYYVRAYAYNSAGYGYGSQVEFDTLSDDIDVGEAAIFRATYSGAELTQINKGNPANASGIITGIEVYARNNMTGFRVGTFYTTNGNTLKCRDSVAIGDVEAGAPRVFLGLSIAVEAGDYIGCYFADGNIFVDLAGFAGLWLVSGEFIDSDDETAYAFYAGFAMSLYGYGDIEVPPVGQPYISRVQRIAGMKTIGVNL